MHSGYYPTGADTADAPWNQCKLPEKSFDVTCSQTLSRTSSCLSNQYEYNQEDDLTDTSNIEWSEEWHGNDHYTPRQLIELFRKCLVSMHESGIVFMTPAQDAHLLKECDGWTEDETEYIEE